MKPAALRARIEGMTYGAHALARVDGKVYFVRHAAPGDEIELEPREDRGSYAFAETTALLAAGAARRTPPCEYLPRCGGCPWQHLEYGAQLAAKQRSVVELLRRIGGIDDAAVQPILAAGDEFGYRRRLSLRVEGGRVGYFAAASHELVPVKRCLLGAPGVAEGPALAQAWVSSLATRLKRIEIAAAEPPPDDSHALEPSHAAAPSQAAALSQAAAPPRSRDRQGAVGLALARSQPLPDGRGSEFVPGRIVLSAQAEGAFRPADDAATAGFLEREPRVAGIAVRGRGWRRAWGEATVAVEVGDGETIALPAGGFVQVNAAANARLLEVVLDVAACGARDRVLDLYAGFGNLSFPLARRAAEVTAVERDRDGVRAGEEHAARGGRANLRFVAADAAEHARRCAAEGQRFDLVVLDPPRSGAAEVVPALLALRPRRIVYVSCNPSTLARDLRRLAPAYAVARVQPIDFFPQTYHVETVAELRLVD